MCVSTIELKLYKPSLNKRTIIDEAMVNYSKAFQYLLDRAYEEIETISEKYADNKGKYKAGLIEKWIHRDLDKELNQFSIEPFKDSIKQDFSATLAGYLNLRVKRGRTVNYPSGYLSAEMLEEEYAKTIYEYMRNTEETDLFESKIKKLIHKSENIRPIFFCRYSTNRNYSLVYNPEKDRYYAKIYLMNVKSEKRKRHAQREHDDLIYIDKNRETFKEGRTKRSFLLFPLSFGRWQEKHLKEAVEKPKMLKTARLIKRKNEYYLSISMVKTAPKAGETKNFMGICRGFDNAANFTIVDKAGIPLLGGFQNANSKNIRFNEIHKIANNLINIAKENKCQIVMEKLIDKGDGLTWKDKNGRYYTPIMDCRAYNQLFDILSYKIIKVGLPKIIRVSSTRIFCTCPNCGIYSKSNRFSGEMIICTSCGMAIDINKTGSLNLARKLIKYSSGTIKIKIENTENGLKFTNKDLEFEYYPSNPYDCVNEFMEEIFKTIENFYDNIDIEQRKANFKRKLGLIKKIQSNKDIFEMVEEN